VDVDGNIHVTDLDGKIRKYDSSGNLLVEWGEAGSAPGQLDGPYGIALDDGYQCIVGGAGVSKLGPPTMGVESATWSTLKGVVPLATPLN
jgi:hypothetical protein